MRAFRDAEPVRVLLCRAIKRGAAAQASRITHYGSRISLFAFVVFTAFGSPDKLSIKSIAFDGSNVVLRAQVPAGIKAITVESKGPAVDSPWRDSLVQPVEAG